MKRLFRFATLLGCCAFVFSSCTEDALTTSTELEPALELAPSSIEGDIIPNQYIFSFRAQAIKPAIDYLDLERINSREEKVEQMEQYNQQVLEEINAFLVREGISLDAVIATYTALQAGVALKLEEEEYDRLRVNEDFEAVEHDRHVELPPFKVEEVFPAGAKNTQQTTCAVTRAGGSVNSPSNNRWIWIIDSGIDLNHPDLNVVTNGTYARSFVGGSPDDCNGHGTHVAGIAAAVNNTIGARGVSAGAPVVPVRVFGCSGGSATSTIVAAVNHVGTYSYSGDVTNMSLGGYFGGGCSSSTPYRNPIRSLGNSGNRVCIAAGNSSANSAFYAPACVNGTRVYTVASMTCSYGFSSFSNYNVNPVDYIATGSSVYSTYRNGGYATLSGTSMATPVVAGICHARNNAPRSAGNLRYRNENYRVAIR
ncbi:MAG: S8 family serine peptidase [Bacteroidota bacterium]